MAHSTYLELLFELGWPGALLLFVAIGSLAAFCVVGIGRRREGVVDPALREGCGRSGLAGRSDGCGVDRFEPERW